MNETEVFELVREHVLSIRKQKPIRVAINGIEGTGKTVFAVKLTKHLISKNTNAIHVSIDGFHNNKDTRYRQGRNSAKGYYEDSYDEIAFVEKVLKSSQLANPHYTTAIHDLKTDQYLDIEPTNIEATTVLITDGAYLFKPHYRQHWDLRIYLKTSFEIAMGRGVKRDKDLLGGFELARDKYERRYHKASRIYQTENDPEAIADIVIDNSDFHNLKIMKNTATT